MYDTHKPVQNWRDREKDVDIPTIFLVYPNVHVLRIFSLTVYHLFGIYTLRSDTFLQYGLKNKIMVGILKS